MAIDSWKFSPLNKPTVQHIATLAVGYGKSETQLNYQIWYLAKGKEI